MQMFDVAVLAFGIGYGVPGLGEKKDGKGARAKHTTTAILEWGSSRQMVANVRGQH